MKTKASAKEKPERSYELDVFKATLKSAIMVSSKDDMRLALNSVRFTCRETGVKLEATDGRRLIVVDTKLPNSNLCDSVFHVSRADCLRFLRLLSIAKPGDVSVEIAKPKNATILLGTRDAKLRVRTVDVQFPPLEQVIVPKERKMPESSAVGVNPFYLQELAVIARLLLGENNSSWATSGLRINPHGAELDPIRFDVASEKRGVSAIYILMPMRMQEDNK